MALDNSKIVFLSYSRKDNKLAEEIDALCSRLSIPIQRDIRDIKYKQSIRQFMKQTADENTKVIAIISPNYLKSVNCMYEAYQCSENWSFQNKMIPIITSDIDIHRVSIKKEYITYWEQRYKTILYYEEQQFGSYKNEIEDTQIALDTLGKFIDYLRDSVQFTYEKIDYFKLLSALEYEFKYPSVLTDECWNWLMSDSGIKCLDIIEFIGDLYRSRNIEISQFPNIPTNERRYFFKNIECYVTELGLTIVLKLVERNDDKEIVMQYSDISDIEESDYRSEIHSKYYFYSINRDKKRIYDRVQKKLKLFNQAEPSDKEQEVLYEGYNDVYRLIVHY